MSAVIDGARDRLRAVRQEKETTPWDFPEMSDFLQFHRVLVFDGTLSNTGWLLMEARTHNFAVIDMGMLRPVTALRGYLETWEKADLLDRLLDDPVMDSYARSADAIVVEAPAVHGHRTESSLIAGLIIKLRYRSIAMHWIDEGFRCPQRAFREVAPAHVSAVLLGNARVLSADRKKQIRDAVIRLHPAAAGPRWNEHIRDAFATGAVFLLDEKRRAVPECGTATR